MFLSMIKAAEEIYPEAEYGIHLDHGDHKTAMEDDLEIYRMHPEHKKVLVFLRTVSDETAVVDYEI